MADQVQYRRGTSAQHAGFTGQAGEATIDTTLQVWRVHDDATAGGWLGARTLSYTTLTGANQSYGSASLFAQLRRSNAGSAMVDTGPALAALAGIGSGAPILVANADSAATLTIDAGGGTTWDGAASVVIAPGRSVLFLWDGASNFNSVQNGMKGLRADSPIQPCAANGTVTGSGGQTLSAALLYGGIITRSAQSAACIDTTDSAANLVAQIPNAFVGCTLRAVYLNTGSHPVTLAGGTNVTLTGQLVVPGNAAAEICLILSNVTGGAQAATGYVVPLLSARNVDQLTQHGDSAYQILPTDRTVATSATLTAARIWTLPLAANCQPGQELVVTDTFGGVSATDTLSVARGGSDTIHGGTASCVFNTPYSWVRLRADGVANWEVVGRSLKATQFTASGTYVPDPGMKLAEIWAMGGGGAGGTGCIQASGTACSGGGGGGGAGVFYARLSAAQIGASVSVAIAAASTTGAAPTGSTPTAGTNGAGGNTTTFGSLMTARGGGGGAGGQLNGNSGGGGGTNGTNAGGNATGASGGSGGSQGGNGGSGVAGTASTNPYGGSGGAGTANGAAGNFAAVGFFGAGGGGSGGGFTTAPAYQNGGAGAAGAAGSGVNSATAGTAGAAGGVVAGGAGNPPGAAFPLYSPGGGGGGGASDSTTAGAGGTGSYGAGGGGGGSALVSKTAGAGGGGGQGLLVVFEYF
jgi:hypothetical protein